MGFAENTMWIINIIKAVIVTENHWNPNALISGNLKAGYHSVVWDANSNASGVYFVKMLAGEYVNTQKLMLIK